MSETNGNGKADTNGNGKPRKCERTPSGGFREKTLEKEWAAPFLEALEDQANVAHACRVAHITEATVYHDRKLDSEFAQAWKESLNKGVSTLEVEVRRRALHGVERTYHNKDGDVTSIETKYSDTLAMFLLKAHKPDTYRENINVNTHHTGEIDFNFQGMTQLQARKYVLDQIAGLTTEG